jgi:hypothetical protein
MTRYCGKSLNFEGKRRTVARMTGLEPATSGVTGRRSNQLSYIRIMRQSAKMDRIHQDKREAEPPKEGGANDGT